MKYTVNLIPHLEELKKIRQFEQDVLNETNLPVVDISHWNPGKEYKGIILSQYNATTPLDISDYHYSYEYNCNLRLKTLQLLIGKSANNLGCVFIHNATSAICCVADYLKKQKYKKLCILEPSYFSTYACLKSFSLNVYKEEVNLDNHGNIELPYDAIIQKGYDVVWLTSPIFSTGIYYSQNQIENINALLQRGTLLVIDESAASPNYTLTHNLYPYENIVSIFSPHKYLALNSTKFAAIICKQSTCKYFEDWIDVFVGALPISACIAIEHFLSPNFNACLEIHDEYIKSNLAHIQKLCVLFPDNYFNGVASNYITICNKEIPYKKSLKDIKIYQIMRQTHVSFVPGYINGFSEKWGFCYRVNLTQNTHILKTSLGKLFSFFS